MIRHRRGGLWWLLVAVAGLAPFAVVPPGSGDAAIAGGGWAGCRVLAVHDGDTLNADCGGRAVKVRFYCIDAPELAQAPWGAAARDHLRGLLTGKAVAIEPVDHDRYGRTVGVVRADGAPVNLAMVADGQAAVYRRYCADARYGAAEAEAKSARRGIWSQPGIQQTPWAYRHG